MLALVGLTHSAPVADISSHVVHHGHHGALVAHGHHAPHLAHPVHPVAHPVHHAVHAPVHHAVHAPVHHAVHAPVHHAVHAPAPYHPAPVVHHPAPYHPAPYAPVHPAPYAPAPVVHKPAYAPAPYVEPKGKEEPYAFQYGVSDDYSKANFNAAESSDGNVVSGSYSVALPDGRIQHVKYTADHYNGYVAEVTYEGTPVYPEAKPYAPAPAYGPVHA